MNPLNKEQVRAHKKDRRAHKLARSLYHELDKLARLQFLEGYAGQEVGFWSGKGTSQGVTEGLKAAKDFFEANGIEVDPRWVSLMDKGFYHKSMAKACKILSNCPGAGAEDVMQNLMTPAFGKKTSQSIFWQVGHHNQNKSLATKTGLHMNHIANKCGVNVCRRSFDFLKGSYKVFPLNPLGVQKDANLYPREDLDRRMDFWSSMSGSLFTDVRSFFLQRASNPTKEQIVTVYFDLLSQSSWDRDCKVTWTDVANEVGCTTQYAGKTLKDLILQARKAARNGDLGSWSDLGDDFVEVSYLDH